MRMASYMIDVCCGLELSAVAGRPPVIPCTCALVKVLAGGRASFSIFVALSGVVTHIVLAVRPYAVTRTDRSRTIETFRRIR